MLQKTIDLCHMLDLSTTNSKVVCLALQVIIDLCPLFF